MLPQGLAFYGTWTLTVLTSLAITWRVDEGGRRDSSPAVASLTALRGTVQERHSGAAIFEDTVEGEGVHIGDTVATGASSSVRVVFLDGHVFLLGPSSQITFEPPDTEQNLVITILKGSVTGAPMVARAGKPRTVPAHLVVHTDGVMLTSAGKDDHFTLSRPLGGPTDVSAGPGQVQVIGRGGALVRKAVESAAVTKTVVPDAVRPPTATAATSPAAATEATKPSETTKPTEAREDAPPADEPRAPDSFTVSNSVTYWTSRPLHGNHTALQVSGTKGGRSTMMTIPADLLAKGVASAGHRREVTLAALPGAESTTSAPPQTVRIGSLAEWGASGVAIGVDRVAPKYGEGWLVERSTVFTPSLEISLRSGKDLPNLAPLLAGARAFYLHDANSGQVERQAAFFVRGGRIFAGATWRGAGDAPWQDVTKTLGADFSFQGKASALIVRPPGQSLRTLLTMRGNTVVKALVGNRLVTLDSALLQHNDMAERLVERRARALFSEDVTILATH
jgi:hypothetical protein